jgi:hypothetical protein
MKSPNLKITNELNRELEQLEKEIKKSESENNIYKNKISEEIKNIDKNKVFNTIHVEPRYTLWQRIMKGLGIN